MLIVIYCAYSKETHPYYKSIIHVIQSIVSSTIDGAEWTFYPVSCFTGVANLVSSMIAMIIAIPHPSSI